MNRLAAARCDSLDATRALCIPRMIPYVRIRRACLIIGGATPSITCGVAHVYRLLALVPRSGLRVNAANAALESIDLPTAPLLHGRSGPQPHQLSGRYSGRYSAVLPLGWRGMATKGGLAGMANSGPSKGDDAPEAAHDVTLQQARCVRLRRTRASSSLRA